MMEQLTGDAVRDLLTEGLDAVRPMEGAADAKLWARRRRRPATATSTAGGAGLTDPAAETADLSGVERRLPRRAELVWEQLKDGADLPPDSAAARLLAPPFAAHALLVRCDLRTGAASLGFVGAELEALCAPAGNAAGKAAGPVVRADASPAAPIADRLVALGLQAISAGAPCQLDSDFDPDLHRPTPPLLFRAIALPLAPAAGTGGIASAIAVVSWRQLLAAGETAELHGELAAAMQWLSGNGQTARD